MREDSASAGTQPAAGAGENRGLSALHLRYRRPRSWPGKFRIDLALDVLCAILAACGLLMMFSARAHYARWPLLGLVLPGLRTLFSPAYRLRLREAFRGQARAIDAFSRG